MDNANNLSDAERSERPSIETMSAGIVTEFHNRISALETQNSELRAQLEASKNSGDVAPYPGFLEHVVHVMQKYHAGDKPDGFDAKYPIDRR